MKKKKPPVKRTKKKPSSPPRFDKIPNASPLPVLVESPHTILDAAVSDAARTLTRAATGGEVTREELSAAQDILNRRGITNVGGRASQIPEAFARQAFAYVFRILGFPPIKWPSFDLVKEDEAENTEVDAFNKALLEN